MSYFTNVDAAPIEVLAFDYDKEMRLWSAASKLPVPMAPSELPDYLGPMDSYGILRNPMDSYRFLWVSIDFYRFLLTSIEFC